MKNEHSAEILRLADDMASAATTFNSHGYDIFISKRGELIARVNQIIADLEKNQK